MSDDSYDADDAAWGESDRRYEAEQQQIRLYGNDWREKQKAAEEESKRRAEVAEQQRKLNRQKILESKTDRERIQLLEECCDRLAQRIDRMDMQQLWVHPQK